MFGSHPLSSNAVGSHAVRGNSVQSDPRLRDSNKTGQYDSYSGSANKETVKVFHESTQPSRLQIRR